MKDGRISWEEIYAAYGFLARTAPGLKTPGVKFAYFAARNQRLILEELTDFETPFAKLFEYDNARRQAGKDEEALRDVAGKYADTAAAEAELRVKYVEARKGEAPSEFVKSLRRVRMSDLPSDMGVEDVGAILFLVDEDR